ncbi:DUF11 domain-containing protein [Xylophilus rhododendri]|uniref:DUF11 domain-containing protein n=1 Tax=Xylophilus rhododendri TaxID=2697032 RepID=A0A857J7S2_9BURK|nr:DUF11 domain-containing protein [Xylophilus rhododendri]QHI98835.1 DUF11 domain-containing protein [Xylophilus rhododendri]
MSTLIFLFSTLLHRLTTAIYSGRNLRWAAAWLSAAMVVPVWAQSAPTVRITTIATNGVGNFGYGLTGITGGAAENIHVASAGVPVPGVTHTGTTGVAASVDQSNPQPGWPLQPVSVSCVDTNATSSGNAAGNLATVSGHIATLPANVMVQNARIQCTFINTMPAYTALTSSGPVSANAADTVAYAINLVNIGPVPTTMALTIQDQLPPGAVATGASPGAGIQSVDCGTLPSAPGALLTCRLATSPTGIALGATGSFSLSVTMPYVNTVVPVVNHLSASTDAVGVPAVAPGPACVQDAKTNCSSTTVIVGLAPLQAAMRFSPEVIGPYGPVFTTMTVTVTNPNPVDVVWTALGVPYPVDVFNSDELTSKTTCPAGWVKPYQTYDGMIAHSGGVELHDATIPAHGSCQMITDLTSVRPGQYTTTIAANTLASYNAPATPTATSAQFEVREFPYVLPAAQPVSCRTSGFVFNTAYASDSSFKPLYAQDDHWMVGVGTAAGPSSVAVWKPAVVAFPKLAVGTWAVSPFSNANWISALSNAAHVGEFVYYRYDFTLAGNIDPATFVLGLNFLADDRVVSIYANEVVNSFQGSGYFSIATQGVANVSQGWKPGANSLFVKTSDNYNLTALMVQGRINAVCASSTVTIKTVSEGGTGAFSYSGSNGFTSQDITTTAAGVAVTGAPTRLGALNVATKITQAAKQGFKLRSASCSGLPGGGTATQTPDGSLQLNAAAVVEGGNIVCTFINAAEAPSSASGGSGRVFSDNGMESGIANDAVANGGERGLPGVEVSLTDCAGKSLAKATTDGDGAYRLPAPAEIATGAALCVEVARSPARTSTGASIGGTALQPGVAFAAAPNTLTLASDTRTDRIAFTWTGTPPEGLNFASVPLSTFLQPGLRNGLPGSHVGHGHIFTAGTLGQVSFSVADSVSSPASAGWSEQIFADPGCTGSLQGGAARLFPPAVPQPVTPGQVVCVVMLQSVPQQAPLGSHNRATVDAAFSFTNAASSLSARYSVDDLTTVSSDALGLLKEVRNVSQGVAAFGLSNQAKPGQTLEYRITYTNKAAEPLRGLVINDNTPAYTSFVGASVGSTPASLTGCHKITPADASAVDCTQDQKPGGKGGLSWTFDGELSPGASGAVLFQVILD